MAAQMAAAATPQKLRWGRLEGLLQLRQGQATTTHLMEHLFMEREEWQDSRSALQGHRLLGELNRPTGHLPLARRLHRNLRFSRYMQCRSILPEQSVRDLLVLALRRGRLPRCLHQLHQPCFQVGLQKISAE